MRDDEPDWRVVYGRDNRGPAKVVRPRTKKLKPELPSDCYESPEERRAEMRDKKHAEFVIEMQRQNRHDILDDVDFASRAFTDWLLENGRR